MTLTARESGGAVAIDVADLGSAEVVWPAPAATPGRLGLVMARALAASQDGRLLLSSDSSGTRFTFLVPAAEPESGDHTICGGVTRLTDMRAVRSLSGLAAQHGGMTTANVTTTSRQMLNKVPEVTVYFWIIKILCTTVGRELRRLHQRDPRLRPDQHHAALLRGAGRRAGRPVPAATATCPGIYWLAVVLISVVGTLLTDNLTDAPRRAAVDQLDRVRGAARRGLRHLVRPGAHAVDPHDRHHPARGLLLADRAGHLRPRHRGRRLDPRADRLVARRVGPAAARPDPRRPRRLEAGRRPGAVASGWPTS